MKNIKNIRPGNLKTVNFAAVLKNYIDKNDTVILAVSGGADSICLLDLCLKASQKLHFKIIIGHVNHNLRGKESDLDEQFVKAVSKKLKIPFSSTKLKPIKKGNVEEQARNLRYAFLTKLLKKYRAKWIITAHHFNDNIETALFNLARGSYLDGLTGMEISSPSRKILRPLLSTTKQQILDYLAAHKLKYRTDQSNRDLKYSRNLLRLKIIPLLKKINPDFEAAFAKNMELLKETADFMEEESKAWLKKNQKGTVAKNNKPHIPLKAFLDQSEILQKNILAGLYKDLHGNTNKFNRYHLEQILAVLKKEQSGLKKEFGSGHFIIIKKDSSNKRVFMIS